MAGAFGMMKENYDLSVRIAEPLVEHVRRAPPGTQVIATGTSCRHQISDLTGAKAIHIAEWLCQHLPG
jgi:Fe-S oxidoreductase